MIGQNALKWGVAAVYGDNVQLGASAATSLHVPSYHDLTRVMGYGIPRRTDNLSHAILVFITRLLPKCNKPFRHWIPPGGEGLSPDHGRDTAPGIGEPPCGLEAILYRSLWLLLHQCLFFHSGHVGEYYRHLLSLSRRKKQPQLETPRSHHGRPGRKPRVRHSAGSRLQE